MFRKKLNFWRKNKNLGQNCNFRKKTEVLMKTPNFGE